VIPDVLFFDMSWAAVSLGAMITLACEARRVAFLRSLGSIVLMGATTLLWHVEACPTFVWATLIAISVGLANVGLTVSMLRPDKVAKS
jgi:hypothetical protein